MNRLAKSFLLVLVTAALSASLAVVGTLAMTPGCGAARHARACSECKKLDDEATDRRILLAIQGQQRPQQRRAIASGPPKPSKSDKPEKKATQ